MIIEVGQVFTRILCYKCLGIFRGEAILAIGYPFGRSGIGGNNGFLFLVQELYIGKIKRFISFDGGIALIEERDVIIIGISITAGTTDNVIGHCEAGEINAYY